MAISSCCDKHISERGLIVLEVIHSSKRLHRYSLPGIGAICEQSKVIVNMGGKTSTLVPQRCARQRGGLWTGRSDDPALPACQPIYTRDNNLHQDCSVLLTRRSGGGRLCEATMVKEKKKCSNIDSKDLACFPRGLSQWQGFSLVPAVTFLQQPSGRHEWC